MVRTQRALKGVEAMLLPLVALPFLCGFVGILVSSPANSVVATLSLSAFCAQVRLLCLWYQTRTSISQYEGHSGA